MQRQEPTCQSHLKGRIAGSMSELFAPSGKSHIPLRVISLANNRNTTVINRNHSLGKDPKSEPHSHNLEDSSTLH